MSSADSGIEVLADGRNRFWIRHDIVKGVTPRMLAWWFAHLEGDITIGSRRYNRDRVWHPQGHVHASYAWRRPDGSLGPGAAIRVHEVLGRDLRHVVNVTSSIEKLDEEGFSHNPALPVARGVGPVSGFARREYTFTGTASGTLYENSLTLGHGSWWGGPGDACIPSRRPRRDLVQAQYRRGRSVRRIPALAVLPGNREARVITAGPNRPVTQITVSVWAHAAVVAMHSAAHVGSGIWMALPATLYIWAVIIIGPIVGWRLTRAGRLVVGSSMVAGCMTGALVFGGMNHFVWPGIDHVSTVPAGAWRIPFDATAVLLAVTEAAGAITGIVVARAFVQERRTR